jgi:cysteinyl-tRNA synthetase
MKTLRKDMNVPIVSKKKAKVSKEQDTGLDEEAELEKRIDKIAEESYEIIKLPSEKFQEIIGRMSNRKKINQSVEWEFINKLIEAHVNYIKSKSLEIVFEVSSDGLIVARI